MNRYAVLLLLLLAGCGASNKYAGTYGAASGSELILSGDGTFRYLIGERTSAQDSAGSYLVSGNVIEFKTGKANPRFTEAKLTDDGFALRTSDGHDWKFVKE